MLSRFRKISLEKQLFINFLSLSVCLLFLSLSITLSLNLTRRRNEIDRSIISIAAYIASLDQVTAMLELGYPTEEARKELDTLYETFTDINVIVIYNTNGLRFYHTDRQQSGETLMEGEEAAILNGSGPYITTGIGSRGTQRRAFHAITNKSGERIGFVMASVYTTYITDQAKALLPAYFVIALIMLVPSILLSHMIVRLLRASLMGHHPQELLDLYLKQETVLNAMEEGIIASDCSGAVIFANQAASRLISTEGPVTGRLIREVFPFTSSGEILKTGVSVSHRSCQLESHPLIYSELPIGSPPDIQGVLTILTDRSEIENLSDELSGARSMLDTLRSFNHEFLNKLHVILGYLQTGQTEQAIQFITNSNLVSSQAIRQTADCLRVSRICAIVIGKMMHAAELGILLTVSPDSRCMNQDLILPIEDYITIIGNLLENAIEELAASGKELKEIMIGIHMSESCTIITCEDTGRGIPEELLPVIFEKGVSSKGENRGTGLFLIHNLTELHHGEIAIDTEAGEGTCFTITFTRKDNV